MVVSSSYCGVFCFVCLRFVYGGVQQLLWYVFCLSSSITIALGHYHTQEEDKQSKTHNTVAVGHHHTQDEGKQNKTHHNSCWTPPYTRRRKTKHTPQ
jgi:hypothetical protein